MKRTELKNLINEAINEVVKEAIGLGVAEGDVGSFRQHVINRLSKMVKYKNNKAALSAAVEKIMALAQGGDKRVCEMWTAWESKQVKEDFDSAHSSFMDDAWEEDPERREFDKKINRHNAAHKERFACPTCKEPEALSSWEKKQGYQCKRCADGEEGVGMDMNEAVAVDTGKKVNQQIADLLEQGHRVYSGAVGRIGEIVKADGNTVYLKRSRGRGDSATSFNVGDPVTIEQAQDGQYLVMNSDKLFEDYHPALRPKHKAWHSGDIEDTTILSLRGLNDVKVDVSYTADIYHGTGAVDDPNDIKLTSLVTEKDFAVAEIENPTEEEQKVIRMYQLAAKKLVPNMSDALLLPKGINLLKLDTLLHNWMEKDINDLTDNAYETHHDEGGRQ